MLTLFRHLECYSPQYIGINDILVAGSKIYQIRPPGVIRDSELIEQTVLCDGLLAFPGLIDQHNHITGGGGEQGFASHVPEITLEDILLAGVSTVVGVLGADNQTKNMEGLLAKAKTLEIRGITTWIYSGSYSMPVVTLTGSIQRDLVLIDKVIGAGEIAISDHRASHPCRNGLLSLSSDTHLGGLLGGKAGVVHIHVGDGKEGLKPLIEIIDGSDLPIGQFVPTHVNRNTLLFAQAMAFCSRGGNIDLTAGEIHGVSVPEAVKRLQENNVSLAKVTVSSDANGSNPDGGATRISALYEDLTNCIRDFGISPDMAFSLATENVAKVLKLYPQKGCLQEGSDADILITDKNYTIEKLVCMGKISVNAGKIVPESR